MKKILVFILLSSFVFLFSACFSSRVKKNKVEITRILPEPPKVEAETIVAESVKGTEEKVEITPQINYDTVLLMYWKAYPCLSACQEYEVFFFASGRTIYRGYANTERQGEVFMRLDSSQLHKYINYAAQQGFFELENHYPTTGKAQGLPGKAIQIRWNDKEKRVQHFYAAPKWLELWEDEMEAFFKPSEE